MLQFGEDRRWRNLIRTLRLRSFTVKIIKGDESEGIFVSRTAYPGFEVYATSMNEAAELLHEIHRHQLLNDIAESALDTPDEEDTSSEEDH